MQAENYILHICVLRQKKLSMLLCVKRNNWNVEAKQIKYFVKKEIKKMSDENSLIAVIENCFVWIEECENFTMNLLLLLLFHPRHPSNRMRHFHIIHISTPTKILYIYFKIFPIIVLQNKIFIGHHWAHVFIQK